MELSLWSPEQCRNGKGLDLELKNAAGMIPELDLLDFPGILHHRTLGWLVPKGEGSGFGASVPPRKRECHHGVLILGSSLGFSLGNSKNQKKSMKNGKFKEFHDLS